jgi:adenine phosphoribosyltransferase
VQAIGEDARGEHRRAPTRRGLSQAGTTMPAFAFSHLVRDVPDFPRAGIVFKDITPLLGAARGFAAGIAAMAEPWRAARIDAIAGIESRGFILGAALARELGVGFVPIRKPGKLPARTIAVDYALEYGSDRLEIHADALAAGARVLLVDDVLATGGTLLAARELVTRVDCTLAGAALLVEIAALGGRSRWPADLPLSVVLRY